MLGNGYLHFLMDRLPRPGDRDFALCQQELCLAHGARHYFCT